jgi:glycosyltransferase involved in cell wall biosynthesis
MLGGAERRYYEIAKRLARHNDVTVYTLNLFGQSKQQIIDNVNVIRIGMKHPLTERSLPQLISFFPALLKGLQSKYDIIDANQGIASFIGFFKYIVKKPVVATFHDIYWKRWSKYYSFPYANIGKFMEHLWSKLRYDKIITVSPVIKRKLELYGFRSKTEIIPNGLDISQIDKVKVKKERNRICFVGRLINYKNVDFLIRSFKKIEEGVSDAELVIVGSGPERKRLESIASRINIKIKFTGFISEKEKIKIIKSSRVLVNPSGVEGFGISLLEAMSCKTVPVGLDLECYKDFCNRKNSILVNELDKIPKVLIKILNDKSLQRKISKNAYITSKKYSWDVIADRIETLYKELLE